MNTFVDAYSSRVDICPCIDDLTIGYRLKDSKLIDHSLPPSRLEYQGRSNLIKVKAIKRGGRPGEAKKEVHFFILFIFSLGVKPQ